MVLVALVPVLAGVLGGCANNLYAVVKGDGADRTTALGRLGIGAVAGALVALVGITGVTGPIGAFLVGYGLIDLTDLLRDNKDVLKAAVVGE